MKALTACSSDERKAQENVRWTWYCPPVDGCSPTMAWFCLVVENSNVARGVQIMDESWTDPLTQ